MESVSSHGFSMEAFKLNREPKLPYALPKLVDLALQRLEAEDWIGAFQFADSACRLNANPDPDINALLLRATILFQRGLLADAINDLKAASIGMPGNQTIACSLLRLCRTDLSHHRDTFHRTLAALLRQYPQLSLNPEIVSWIAAADFSAMGAAWQEGQFIAGWAVSNHDATAKLTIELDNGFLVADTGMPTPWLAAAGIGNGHNGFRLKLPARFSLLRLGIAGVSLWGCPFLGHAGLSRSDMSKPLPVQEIVDVIVPVYSGYSETLACLDSIKASQNRSPYRVLVVDDAGPDQNLRNALMEKAQRKEITLISRPINAGFSGAVNTGLGFDTSRDAVLLNADTLVFGDWLDRLRAVAYSHDDIATVTPLSNHGELLSYPMPMYENPVMDVNHAERVDSLFRSYGPNETIDIPVGVGFCFYIKRQALNAVGLFDEGSFGRGYGEDTDICLRFQAQGWRNVCAANTYVVHWGSRSFGAEKQQLVAKNLPLLHAKYPKHSDEYDQFLDADPLRQLRRTVQRRWLAEVLPQYRATLFVGEPDAENSSLYTGHSDLGEALDSPSPDGEGRVRRIKIKNFSDPNSPHPHPLHQERGLNPITEHGEDASGVREVICNQSLSCTLSMEEIKPERWRMNLAITGVTGLDTIAYDWPQQFEQLKADILAAGFKGLVFNVFGDWPAQIVDELTDGFMPFSFRLMDYSGYCPRKYRLNREAMICDDPVDTQVCSNCVSELGPLVYDYADITAWRERALRISSKAEELSAESGEILEAYLNRYPVLVSTVDKQGLFSDVAPSFQLPSETKEPIRIAVLSASSLDQGYLQLLQQAEAALKRKLQIDFIVFGSTMNDSRLQQLPNVYLAGEIAKNQLSESLRLHDCRAIANFSPFVQHRIEVEKLALRHGFPLFRDGINA